MSGKYDPYMPLDYDLSPLPAGAREETEEEITDMQKRAIISELVAFQLRFEKRHRLKESA